MTFQLSLGKLLNLSESQFLHLQYGDNNSTYFIELLRGENELNIHYIFLYRCKTCLTQSTCIHCSSNLHSLSEYAHLSNYLYPLPVLLLGY